MSFLNNFTEEERHTIDDIYYRKFANLTPEEVQLFARYKAAEALEEEEFQAEQQRQDQLLQTKIEQSQAMTDAALEHMHALRDVALAKLQAVKNG